MSTMSATQDTTTYDHFLASAGALAITAIVFLMLPVSGLLSVTHAAAQTRPTRIYTAPPLPLPQTSTRMPSMKTPPPQAVAPMLTPVALPQSAPTPLAIRLPNVSAPNAELLSPSMDFSIATPAPLSAPPPTGEFQLSELDGPPHLLTPVRPVYPPRARRRNIEGEVTLSFVILPDGQVENVTVDTSTPQDVFDNAARAAVLRWRFSPPTRQGRPVRVRARQTIHFSLEH